jgi:hypothetical protein
LLEERAKNNVYRLKDDRDEFIIQLLKWFKNECFKWVNEKPCSTCNGKTTNKGSMCSKDLRINKIRDN